VEVSSVNRVLFDPPPQRHRLHRSGRRRWSRWVTSCLRGWGGQPLYLLETLIFQFIALGRTYHAVQQWEEARSTLEEAEAVAESLGHGFYHVPTLSHLCMNCVVAGQWGQAHTYAMQAMTLRGSLDRAMILLDFSPQYETEALLRAGEERQARAEVQRLGERLGPNRRFRIPYLRSLAVLAAWEGEREQAIDHLQEAAGLAADLGLPGEQWQIQAALGSLYEGGGEPVQARIAFGEDAAIIQELAEGIKDEALRSRFLAGPQIQPVVQHAQRLANPVPQDHAEQSRL
jgi:tetratricopeptide (TPR) repeat protein